MRFTYAFPAFLLSSAAIAQNTAPSVWFEHSTVETANILANLCADQNAIVIEQNSNHVVCSKTMTGLRGAFAQALMGNSHSTQPEIKIRFGLMQDGEFVRVQASQWMETQMAFGQIRREPMNNRKQNTEIIDALIRAGGHSIPPKIVKKLDIIPTPVPNSPPQ